MELMQHVADQAAYLAADDVIDHDHALVRETAARLGEGAGDAYTYAEAAYAFVRDTIPHSADSGDQRVTWRASDVLRLRTGICHAKAHALTALLRAASIPGGLCYQRLTDDDSGLPGDGGSPGAAAVVHGLVALRLPADGPWARCDPRGNKPGVDARFSLGTERPAYVARPEFGESDYPEVYARPPEPVLTALQQAADREQLAGLLPASLQHKAESRKPPAGYEWPAASAGVGAVPPRWAGSHQESSGPFGRTG